MKASENTNKNLNEIAKRLQKDVDAILDEFQEFLKAREDDDTIKIHFDVDFVIKSIHNRRRDKKNEVREQENELIRNSFVSSHGAIYNASFFENPEQPKKQSRFLDKPRMLLFG